MEFIVTYLIYILALIGVIFLFLFFAAKRDVLRTRRDILKYLIDKGYETDKIDLNNYLK